jgi:hypothetical protein
MTKEEFMIEYGRLLSVRKEFYSLPARRDLIAKHVMGLSHNWWRSLVDRIILSREGSVDIEEAARGERRALSGLRVAKVESEAYTAFSRHMSERGLEETLKTIGTNSLWDAVQKRKEK